MSSDSLFAVDGLTCAVTGAASGIGYAIAEALLERGAHVTLIDSSAERVEECRRQLVEKSTRLDCVVANICDHSEIASVLKKVVDRRGALDVFFANAGISGGPGPARADGRLASVTSSKWSQVLDVNLSGTFFSICAAADLMTNPKGGRIIVTSSISGLRGDRHTGYAYGAAKAAINNLVRQAAIELSSRNILVNAICPGAFATNIANGRLHDPEVAKIYRGLVPLGRIASPEEIKGIALFLASPASSYITGAIIPIDGGVSAALG